ncbi:hypothetical protein [Gottfriedia luciferensis]|uniref:hypothetical protein n=1 Tax=Gottfriedia luciferensis TaxID=178774 RepID=UPI000B42F57B|nr:hypothetical protein [Gottfriedia luciferensis]
MLYKAWLIISIFVSLFFSINFYPTGPFEDEFLLFNNIVIIFIFVPSTFILASCFISLFANKRYVIMILFLIASLIIGFKLISFYHIIIVIIILLGGLVIASFHLALTKLLKIRSNCVSP